MRLPGNVDQGGLKKLTLTEPVAVYLGRELPANGFDLLHISFAHATAVGALPQHHKDPFDRLLAAQARVEDMPLVSTDVVFDSYDVPRVW